VSATYPQIKAVITISAPVIIHGSVWTYQGQPVPYLADNYPEFAITHPFLDAVGALAGPKDPLPLIPNLVAQLEASHEVALATIPVEKIKAPVLLISGVDDLYIPSTLYGELAIDLLKNHNFANPYRHIINPGAGHGILYPYIPEWNDKRDEMGKRLGGNAPADAKADAVSWPIILKYLGMMK
jgi:pimeloyl-ACP methyl ester carboxylesterase